MIEEQCLNSLELGKEPSRPLVVISILNWYGWKDTLECLNSVRRLDYPNYLTVVVDNGSGNDSVERIRAWATATLPDQRGFADYSTETALQGGVQGQEAALQQLCSQDRFVLIRNRENLGFTGGNNVTIEYALRRPNSLDYVFFLNNDATIDPHCLEYLVEADRKTRAGIVGAITREPGTGRVLWEGPDPIGRFPLVVQFFPFFRKLFRAAPSPGEGLKACFWVNGAAMMIRRQALEAVHTSMGYYLDDAMFMYLEEIDFCGQARKHGYNCVLVKGAAIYHEAASGSGGVFAPIWNYYCARNRIRLARHLLPWPLLMVFHVMNLPSCVRRALRVLWRGRADSAWAIFRGVRDGYRGRSGKWIRHDQETRKYA
jgi:hypothetical protein